MFMESTFFLLSCKRLAVDATTLLLFFICSYLNELELSNCWIRFCIFIMEKFSSLAKLVLVRSSSFGSVMLIAGVFALYSSTNLGDTLIYCFGSFSRHL